MTPEVGVVPQIFPGAYAPSTLETHCQYFWLRPCLWSIITSQPQPPFPHTIIVTLRSSLEVFSYVLAAVSTISMM